jgi:hypothetical protein
VKVVEGSEIYNFPIDTLVHVSCKKLCFYRSNRASPKQFQADATSPALQRARAPARAPYAAPTSEPPRAFLRLVPQSHARRKAAWTLPPPRTARRPANTRWTAGRSGVPPARHSRRGRRVLLGVRRRSLGHWHARGSPINEAVTLPLAHDLPAARLDARRCHGRRAGVAATSGRLHAKPRSPPPFPALL